MVAGSHKATLSLKYSIQFGEKANGLSTCTRGGMYLTDGVSLYGLKRSEIVMWRPKLKSAKEKIKKKAK